MTTGSTSALSGKHSDVLRLAERALERELEHEQEQEQVQVGVLAKVPRQVPRASPYSTPIFGTAWSMPRWLTATRVGTSPTSTTTLLRKTSPPPDHPSFAIGQHRSPSGTARPEALSAVVRRPDSLTPSR